MTEEEDDRCRTIREELGGETLENETRRILSEERVKDVTEVNLVSRIPYDVDTLMKGQPTIIIVARWMDDGCSVSWGRAVTRIKKFIDSKRLASKSLAQVDIAVEMIAEELVTPKYMSPVSAELLARGMATDWPRIKDEVARILESHPGTKGHTTAINLFKLGFTPNNPLPQEFAPLYPHERSTTSGVENPNTVYVSVDYDCHEKTWPPVIRDIQQYLKRFQYADLHVHMEHNIVEQCPFRLVPCRGSAAEIEARQKKYNLLPEMPYQRVVNLGADVGTCNYITATDGTLFSPLIGTLGCWVVITTNNYPNGVKVALVNYHVIRTAYSGFKLGVGADGGAIIEAPEKGSALWKLDEEGTGPKTGAPKLEHPTRSKHNNGVHYRETMIQMYKGHELEAEAQDELNGMLAFFNNNEQVLGTVYCASGYKRRTKNNGRLDWALIMPLSKARVGENTLPSFKSWSDKYALPTEFPDRATFGGSLRQPTESGLRGLSQGAFVYKVGATTEATIGKFSQMKANVKISEDQHLLSGNSEEFCYIQGGTLKEKYGGFPFALLGDSGSVVWDKEGRAAGLLYRGQRPQKTGQTFHYVTPIHDVFEDIKKFSGGAIKEIRIAEPAPGK
jgi:hypothetical protein